MIRALVAIVAGGGRVWPMKGGWWTVDKVTHLLIEPEPQSSSGIVGTLTIRALERRGALKRAMVEQRDWLDARDVTDVGRKLAQDLS
jgi:hypothetical protein